MPSRTHPQRPSGRLLALWVGLILAVALLSGVAAAETTFNSLDTQTQDLKQDVLELNRDLFLLEEELLFPSSTQVAIFVSMDAGVLFDLDSVQVKIDDKVVANYLYTERELEALRRGGVHRIHMDNVKTGEHEIVALFVGKGPNDRDYRRGASAKFTKDLGPRFLELRVIDSGTAQQPEFQIKQW